MTETLHSLVFQRELFTKKLTMNPRKLIPRKVTESISFRARPYNLQFAPSGSFCFLSTQGSSSDHRVVFYDTTTQHFEKLFEFRASIAQWTISDFTISPDTRFVCYSTLNPILHIAQISQDGVLLEKGKQFVAPLCNVAQERFAVWSVKYSGDGRELIAGTNDCSIYIYDVEVGRALHRIEGHSDDVNSVCFVDPADSNVVVSGSDDHLIKIWDRRSMGTESRCAGYLVGHTEGITCVSSKGDGRYLLSNGKDQTLKLWDIRKTISSYDEDENRLDFTPSWDYRWMVYPNPSPVKHPNDSSARTFVGHTISKTLIRCYFSPSSTGHQFAYTGSANGFIYIYDIQGEETIKIRVSNEDSTFDPFHNSLVRDLSWHPSLPVLVAGQWTDHGGKLLKIQPNFA